ncbi:molybdopterin molybdotransferase MoeA [Sedimentitalea nanhaiensis]|uniref:Molybdopterin molybdenumtransferase n=1 Tax=Sedimentitalea nanhaiensis TaxID=999627 RepID=A0A1I7EBY7_9RHOB|nr:gephyrin-like molybdotransferase Glp [Sedimentitalea nanhaiensis]SFU21402.1 molybdopterin molybdotransferase [Sedimentitalea nanhaiensis]
MDGANVSTGCGCDGLAGSQQLLSCSEARALALANVRPILQQQTLPLAQALGWTAAADIFAPRAMPYFNNSAMDGFALRLADLEGRCCLPVAGTVAAGDAPCELPTGAAMRIYTGAPLPEGADTVAMIETCIDKVTKVHFSTAPTRGSNIRRAGSDQDAGQLLLRKGTRIAPRHIGLLAANGLHDIAVVRRPRVAVFSTGNEVTAGPCAPGQIPDANRPLLCALLAEHAAEVSDLGILPDDPDATAAAFADLGGQFDLIMTSGAVSMGGKDHIRDALIAAGGDIQGWRVAIKPGKPVLFGTLGDAVFTGLPGNPFAAYVGFHMFVLAQLARMSGAQPAPFAATPASAGFEWQRKAGRAEVFPVRLKGYDANGLPVLQRLGASVSATLVPLAEADGVAIVAAETSAVSMGDILHWHPFCTIGALT